MASPGLQPSLQSLRHKNFQVLVKINATATSDFNLKPCRKTTFPTGLVNDDFKWYNSITCFGFVFVLCNRSHLELPGVVRVIPNSLHRLQTTRSWDFLGLSSHYPTNILQNSKMGDGVIIGVFDTGS